VFILNRNQCSEWTGFSRFIQNHHTGLPSAVHAVIDQYVSGAQLNYLPGMPLHNVTSNLAELLAVQNDVDYQLERIRVKEAEQIAHQHRSAVPSEYVPESRIEHLKAIHNADFDLSKLIQLCIELNLAHANKCYYSVGMLCRAIIDHVPPIFACKTFTEIANNYSGSASFKKGTKSLSDALRNLADGF